MSNGAHSSDSDKHSSHGAPLEVQSLAKLTAIILIAAVLLALSWEALGLSSWEPEAPAARPPAALDALRLDEGRRWVADSPVRSSMETLRDAIDAGLESPDDRLDWLASLIREEVRWMRAETTIAAEAREQLDTICAELLEAADLMERSVQAERDDGLDRALEAVIAYGRFFDHPGWDLPRVGFVPLLAEKDDPGA